MAACAYANEMLMSWKTFRRKFEFIFVKLRSCF